MKLLFEKGTKMDVNELEKLYDALNDYLARHTNFPGWIKGVYPVRKTAEDGIEEGTLFVARSSGQIIGTVILRHEPEAGYSQADWHVHLEDAEVFVVYTLAVHPQYLGKGVGKALIEFAVRYSVEQKAKAVRLDVYENNTPAIGLYKKCGFHYVDTVDLGCSNYGLNRFELYQKLL
ncbi:GNAT family N-acetyltransferase [Clostridium sp. D33t1_170424_F3]|uniref:GNAT family N-acetyltransferase n=1 Tax=Clostridium sp. D33t1_170424_F3 TaxID=2787099 RepID=UPI0018AB472B|nr:GNAT family N-acetyltransferase [Clostridium sp. D33t1_170424_F3]